MMAAQLAVRRSSAFAGTSPLNLIQPKEAIACQAASRESISVMFLQNCDLQDKTGKYGTQLKA
ncbi:hypothetical protein XFUD_06035 [Xylella fastidiosa]|nr:hypothetical protein XFUD_06035 [Xylella fastidiosa]OCA58042.1 hypothetical protein AA93_05980 [Xylella fastidiosa subsp. pauca 11399]ALR01657.1 hypothetical protein OY18_04710 [Xylella fastidiosa]KXB15595.1 hypothetical protein ADT29_03050 [Xylella fastidiosa]KXB22080.1 hypothetical protein ADT28_04250 [Xylella fastidiosa]